MHYLLIVVSACYINKLARTFAKFAYSPTSIRLLALVISFGTVPYTAIGVSTVLTPYRSTVATRQNDVTGNK